MSSLHCRFVYTVTAPSNGVLQVYTVGSTFDTLLAVYVSTDGTIGGFKLTAGMFSDDCQCKFLSFTSRYCQCVLHWHTLQVALRLFMLVSESASASCFSCNVIPFGYGSHTHSTHWHTLHAGKRKHLPVTPRGHMHIACTHAHTRVMMITAHRA